MSGQLVQLSLFTDPASSLKTVSHQTALRNIMFHSREWSTCLLNWEKNIWLFIYVASLWTLPNRLINITLHIHVRANIWLAISCIMTCIMIVSHTNRPDNFSQSPCTVPSCRLVGWLVGWLNRFIYRANIARTVYLYLLQMFLLTATLQYLKLILASKKEQGGQYGEAHVFGSYQKLVNTQLLQRIGASCIRWLHSNFISTTYATGKTMWHQEIKH